MNDLRPCSGTDVCVENNCLAAGNDAAVDADAMTDAPGVHAFDIAYPNEWRFSVAGPISGYFLAINTSAADLNMSSLELKSIEDDHPTAIVRINVTPSPTLIPTGQVGGHLTPLSEQTLIGTGLVTEPRADTMSDYLSLAIENAPDGMYDIAVDLVIAIDDVRIAMPITIHMVPLTVVFADPLIGKRIAVYR